MTNRSFRFLPRASLLALALGLASASAARADCESDLKQLETAFATPALSTGAKAALEEAKTKAVTALRKDDDASCHTAVVEGVAKAGLKMK